MTLSVRAWPDSPLDAVDNAFALLTSDPCPLMLDLDACDRVAGLPHGAMALPALRSWLLGHPQAYAARDSIWRELIRRARLDGPAWVIVATAMALPALRRYAGHLCRGRRSDARDVDAEILAGFLTALRDRVDASQPAPYAKLCAAAWRAGYQLRMADARQPIPIGDMHTTPASAAPHRPYRHPDLLIRRAAQRGIIDEDDEQAYVDVRLGGRAIEPIAQRLGIRTDALRRRLKRTDERIVEALSTGLLADLISPITARELAAAARHRQRIRVAATRETSSGLPTA